MQDNKDKALYTVLRMNEGDFQRLLASLSDADFLSSNPKLLFLGLDSNDVNVHYVNPVFFIASFLSQDIEIDLETAIQLATQFLQQNASCLPFQAFEITDLFSYFDKKSKDLTTRDAERINGLISKRNFRAYIEYCLSNFKSFYNISDEDCGLISKYCDKIFGSDEDRQDIISNLGNSSIFSADNALRNMVIILTHSFESIKEGNEEARQFYVSETEVQKFMSVYDSPEFKKHKFPILELPYEYPQKISGINLSSELQDYIDKSMPPLQSDEEHALFIYYKLCQTFIWDNKYPYMNNHYQAVEYLNSFSSETMKELKPGSSTFCQSLCLAIAQMINSSVNSVEANVLKFSIRDSPHTFLWIRSDNMSAVFDPTLNPEPSIFEDYANAKLGLPIFCKQIIYEKDKNYIYKMLDRIQHIVHPEPSTISQYVGQLRNIIRETPHPINTLERLEAFVDMLKELPKDSGTVLELFLDLKNGGFFGVDEKNVSFLVEPKSNYGCLISVADSERKGNYFVLDIEKIGTEGFEIQQLSYDEIQKKIATKEWDYQNPNYPVLEP